ncbi:small nuclear ribonucleoprotein E-like [Cetorhinus maximus]
MCHLAPVTWSTPRLHLVGMAASDGEGGVGQRPREPPFRPLLPVPEARARGGGVRGRGAARREKAWAAILFPRCCSCGDGAGDMAYRGQAQKVQKVMVQPINLIFRYLQNRSRIQVWLYEQVNMRIEGCIIGFDEYMNLVLDDAEEIHMKSKSRKPLGRVMLKGDNITLLQSVHS